MQCQTLSVSQHNLQAVAALAAYPCLSVRLLPGNMCLWRHASCSLHRWLLNAAQVLCITHLWAQPVEYAAVSFCCVILLCHLQRMRSCIWTPGSLPCGCACASKLAPSAQDRRTHTLYLR